RIFSWCHPQTSSKFCRLCKSLESALKTKHFAKMNLTHFGVRNESYSENNKICCRPRCEMDMMFFWWPRHFQQALVDLRWLNLEELNWSHDSYDFDNNSTVFLWAEIPSAINLISNLRVLSLDNCALFGEIPRELYELVKLTKLTLSENQLTGSIDGSAIGGLKSLEVLDLSCNTLTGTIPHEIKYLVQLTHLMLHNNKIEGPLVHEIGSLVNLRHVYLHNNLLSGGIPSELQALVRIEEFHADNNHLSGLIPSLWGWENCQICDFRNNDGLTRTSWIPGLRW
ncbi:hypothetical protein HK100_011532, partial [Physocladia obscura]